MTRPTNMPCTICGKRGHVAASCPLDKFQRAEARRRTALRVMRCHKNCTMREISNSTGLDKASAYKMLVSMEKRGEVVRVKAGQRVYWKAIAMRTTPADAFKKVLTNNLPGHDIRVRIRKPAAARPVVRLFGGL